MKHAIAVVSLYPGLVRTEGVMEFADWSRRRSIRPERGVAGLGPHIPGHAPGASTPSPSPVIETRGLTRHYGDVVGIEDLDLEVLPDELVLDGRTSGEATLRFLDGLFPARSGPARRGELCERLGLSEKDLGRPVREYSRGMKWTAPATAWRSSGQRCPPRRPQFGSIPDRVGLLTQRSP